MNNRFFIFSLFFLVLTGFSLGCGGDSTSEAPPGESPEEIEADIKAAYEKTGDEPPGPGDTE